MAKKRYNFTFSPETGEILEEIPPGQRSKYVEEAIYEKKLVAKREDFIKKYKKRKKPIWSDEDHPDLMTPEDIANYKPLSWRMDLK